MQSHKNSNTVSRYFSLAILASRLLKNTNHAPVRNRNSRIPLLFSAPIPNIATKISEIPHPAKPIVDPQNAPLVFLGHLKLFLIIELVTVYKIK